MQLGALQLESATRALRIDVKASVNALRQVPLSFSEDPAKDSRLLTHAVLEQQQPWVCRGRGLCVLVDIIVDDKFLPTNVLQDLGHALMTAEAGSWMSMPSDTSLTFSAMEAAEPQRKPSNDRQPCTSYP